MTLRALFSGVSGLRNHQTRMDVIGNNIANVNTVGFKSSRVTFEEAFAQLLRGATRPSGDRGGLNPMAIGLGINIGSVDQNFSQGNLESTGISTDLAIQGDAFFVASDGNSRFYTRSGNFQLDAGGRLVVPTNGFAVQGVTADSTGLLPTGTALTDIIMPLGLVSPAVATSEVTLTGNLDSRPDPLGTILRTSSGLLAIEQTTSNGGAGSDMSALYAAGVANSDIVGMISGRTTMTVSDGTTSQTYTYVSLDTGAGDQAFNSLSDLVAEINNDFATMTASLNDTTGAIEVTAGGAPIVLSVASSNSTLQSAMSGANGALAAAATATTDEFSHEALTSDLIANLRDAQGQGLGVGASDTILIDGQLGGVAVTAGSLAVGGTSTYQDLLTAVDAAFGITNPIGSEVVAGTGAFRITGDGGTANELAMRSSTRDPRIMWKNRWRRMWSMRSPSQCSIPWGISTC